MFAGKLRGERLPCQDIESLEPEMGVWGLGFRVRVWDSGFRAEDLGFEVAESF